MMIISSIARLGNRCALIVRSRLSVAFDASKWGHSAVITVVRVLERFVLVLDYSGILCLVVPMVIRIDRDSSKFGAVRGGRSRLNLC